MQKQHVSPFTVTKPVDPAVAEVSRALRAVHALRSKSAHPHLDYTTREAGILETKAALRHARVSFVSGFSGKTSGDLAEIKRFADLVFGDLAKWYETDRTSYASEATVFLKSRRVTFTVPAAGIVETIRPDFVPDNVRYSFNEPSFSAEPEIKPAEKEDASDEALLQELASMIPTKPLLDAASLEPLSEHSDSIGDVGIVNVPAEDLAAPFVLGGSLPITSVGWLQTNSEAQGLSGAGAEEEGSAHVDGADGTVVVNPESGGEG